MELDLQEVSNSKIDRFCPFNARLLHREPLTKEGSTKQTYHISLDIKDSGLQFKVGDSIGIYGQNDPILVEKILLALRADGHEEIVEIRSKKSFSLRDFLSKKANLFRLTSSLLQFLLTHGVSAEKQNSLIALLDPEHALPLSTYIKTHDLLDALQEFSPPSLPLQSFCEQLGPLLPRFYSIASSLQHQNDQIDLTVALLSFEHRGELRYGLASHFLCHLAEERSTQIPIYVQPSTHFTLPSNTDLPIIMVGPGTGIAPFRAFMQERLCTGASGKNWLFFGERHRAYDFFYEDLWLNLVQKQQLKLDLAFSRDQEERVYVQHCIWQQRQALWAWLQEGAILYVCGNAEQMAKGVEATLVKIFEEQGNLSTENAKALFLQLRKEKRYLADVY